MFWSKARQHKREWAAAIESFTSLRSQIEAALSSNIISIGGAASMNGYDAIMGSDRIALIEQSRYHFSKSALGFLPIALTTWFALGMGGMSIDKVVPTIDHSKRGDDLVPELKVRMVEQEDFLHAFWEQRITEQIFSSFTAQEQIANKLQVDGDLFITIIKNSPMLPKDFGVRLIDTMNIEAIIRDPTDDAVELYYKRRYTEPSYQFEGTGQGISTIKKTGYHASTEYQEWADTSKHQKSDYANRASLDGDVYHVTFGTDPLLHWGTPTLVRAIPWIEGHTEIAGDMRTLIRALSTFVRDIKATPGTKSQLVALQSMTDSLVSTLATGGLKHRPVVGSDIIHGENVTVQPYDVKTGAADITSKGLRDMVLMVAAGTGIPEHMFGNPSTANLATARSLELPVLKKVRAFQAILKGVYSGVLNYILMQRFREKAGRVEIKLPPILERNVGEYITAITSAYMSDLLERDPASQMATDILETRI